MFGVLDPFLLVGKNNFLLKLVNFFQLSWAFLNTWTFSFHKRIRKLFLNLWTCKFWDRAATIVLKNLAVIFTSRTLCFYWLGRREQQRSILGSIAAHNNFFSIYSLPMRECGPAHKGAAVGASLVSRRWMHGYCMILIFLVKTWSNIHKIDFWKKIVIYFYFEMDEVVLRSMLGGTTPEMKETSRCM